MANDNQMQIVSAQILVFEMLSDLLATTSPEKMGESLTQQVRELTGSRTVMLLAHDPAPGVFSEVVKYVNPRRRMNAFSDDELKHFCIKNQPFTASLPVLVSDWPADHPLKEVFERERFSSAIHINLNAAGEHVGSLVCVDLPEPNRIDDVVHVLNMLAPIVGVTLRNNILYQLANYQREKLTVYATELETIVSQRTQELEKRNVELERIIYTVSHDLKTPVVTFSSFLELLRMDIQKDDPSLIANDLNFMDSAVQRMALLLESILEFSRLGYREDKVEQMTSRELIQDMVNVFSASINQKNAEMLVDEDSYSLWGDRTRLSEIWHNLLENALKYANPNQQPVIEVGSEKCNGEVVFFVRDNGIGIDTPYLEKVFDLFEQLDAGSEGSGAGLAIVKRVVESYAGEIWIKSAGLNHGSCFYFTLPKAMVPPEDMQ